MRQVVVGKIAAYESQATNGAWTNQALMVADLCPNVVLDTSSSNGWIRYHPGLTLAAAFREAELSMAALRQLPEIWSRRRKFREGSAAQRALALLIGFPVVTPRRLASELDITYAAANKGIAQLAGTGILTEGTGRARNRIFIAREVRRIYNRPFGDEPELPNA
jgi:hypothetical protein